MPLLGPAVWDVKIFKGFVVPNCPAWQEKAAGATRMKKRPGGGKAGMTILRLLNRSFVCIGAWTISQGPQIFRIKRRVISRPGKMNQCGTARAGAWRMPLPWKRLHLKPRPSNWQTLVFQTAGPSKLFSRQSFVCFQIFRRGFRNHLRRQHRAGRGFVPIQRFQVISDELLVKTRLALARRVLVGGPEA
jgi:hypothetical protein